MAAAYAALVSLLNTITLEQAPRRHPHGRQISIDHDEGLIEAIKMFANIWVTFLEAGFCLQAQDTEDRLVDVAYAAEDAIESYVVDQVLPGGDTSQGENGSAQLSEDLRKIVQEMESMLSDHLELINRIQEEKGGCSPCDNGSSTNALGHDRCGSSPYAGSSSAPLHGEKSTMVGFEDVKKKIIEDLMWGNLGRTVVPIVGMGGLGKTTLARNIYEEPDIMLHFDIRAWVMVSQEYNIREIFIGVLKDQEDEEMLRKQSEENLRERVYRTLFGRRYLIVLDDLWSLEAWENIQRFFPDDGDGSRIMLTTRDTILAFTISPACIRMTFLDEIKSWKLLCEKVFGPNIDCPEELKDVGEKISRNCKGLPLSIVVIGGLLAKSKDRKHWEYIAQELSSKSAIHLDEGQQCSKILSLSYNQLPIYLKPCFLYMVVFPKDHVILLSELINLWIAEGLLMPCKGKSLEETAETYIVYLSGANLITIYSRFSTGEKCCNIHDLLRELCLREAQNEKFLCVVTSNTLPDPPCLVRARRIAILLNRSTTEEYSHIIDSLPSTSLPRSLIVNDCKELSRVLASPTFKLLRVFFVTGADENTKDAREQRCLSNILFNLVNLRYLECGVDNKFMHTLASSIGLMGNLQTLVVENLMSSEKVPYEIWNLPQLRCVAFEIISLDLELPFHEQEHDSIVLRNLHTIETLLNFKFEDGMLKKISNVKELNIWYTASYLEHNDWSDYNFQNLDRLQKLESLKCNFFYPVPNCNDFITVFPRSLKKLSLSGCSLPWEDMTMIGSLPLLEVLELRNDSFIGAAWLPVEGEFLCLKFLYMRCLNLTSWSCNETHFPCLQHLVLYDLQDLEELPLEIGDIATLRMIEMDYCPDALVKSAKNILEEQQELGNDGLLVRVILGMENNLSSTHLGNKNMLVDTKRRECYMRDVLKRATEMMGLADPSGDEDCPDEFTGQDSNSAESSTSEDYKERQKHLYAKYMLQMRILTEYR